MNDTVPSSRAPARLHLVPAAATGQPSGDELLHLWVLWMRAAGASKATIRTRTGCLRALCAHAGGSDPAALNAPQIVAWLAGCRSPWTRRTYATSARQWHRWLVQHGYRGDDPTALVPTPPQPRGVPRPVPDDALRSLLARAPRRARAYMTLAAYEGLRVHEIAKVRGEDFDGAGWLYVEGKGDVRAALPVHPAVEQLRRGWPGSGWWFPGSDDGHVRAESVSHTISGAFRRAGHDVTAHQLRHWFGTQVQRETGDLRVTQELMRHASITSTQIYTEVSGRAKVAAVHRVGRRRPGVTS